MTPRCVFTLMIFRLVILGCCAANGIIWHKHKQEFVQLLSVPQFAVLQKENLAKRREIEMHNFNKEVVKVTYYEAKNMAMFYNETKVTGINGDIWNLLADYLNFTLIPLKASSPNFGSRMKNGSYNGLIGMLVRNETQVILRSGFFSSHLDVLDYTMPIWRSRYHIYVRPAWLYDNSWVFTLFSPIVWYSIVFLFIILSLVGYFLEIVPTDYKSKSKKEDTVNFSLGDHVFYSYSIMCAQGYVPDAFHNNFKILSVSKNMFAWLILTAYSSHLIHNMANKNMILPFKDIETLFNNTKYILLAYSGSSLYSAQDTDAKRANKKQDNERVQLVDLPEEMYSKICYHQEKYAMFEIEDRFMALSKYRCPLQLVGNFNNTWMTSAVRKDFQYKRTIDVAFIKIKEVGLLDALKDQWLNIRLEKKTKNVFERIDLQQVYLIFLILCYGMLMSLVILALEYIVYYYKKFKRRDR